MIYLYICLFAYLDKQIILEERETFETGKEYPHEALRRNERMG